MPAYRSTQQSSGRAPSRWWSRRWCPWAIPGPVGSGRPGEVFHPELPQVLCLPQCRSDSLSHWNTNCQSRSGSLALREVNIAWVLRHIWQRHHPDKQTHKILLYYICYIMKVMGSNFQLLKWFNSLLYRVEGRWGHNVGQLFIFYNCGSLWCRPLPTLASPQLSL